MDMDDAYAVQAAFVDHKLAAGGSLRGWKIGLTSKAMQNALNIDIPDSGLFRPVTLPATVPLDTFTPEANLQWASELAGSLARGAASAVGEDRDALLELEASREV